MRLADRLKNIAHLRLDLEVPYVEILAEVTNVVDHFSSVQINLDLRQDKTPRPWFSRGLIDYLPNSTKQYEFLALKPEWIARGEDGETILSHTELYESLPKTVAFIELLTSKPRVTRLMCIPPGAFLPWHSHCQSRVVGPMEYQKMVVQVPLKTNSGVINRVKPMSAPDGQSWDQHYAAGEAWLFNSWHEHAVYNGGNEERIILFVECPLEDKLFKNHVEHALARAETAFLA